MHNKCRQIRLHRNSIRMIKTKYLWKSKSSNVKHLVIINCINWTSISTVSKQTMRHSLCFKLSPSVQTKSVYLKLKVFYISHIDSDVNGWNRHLSVSSKSLSLHKHRLHREVVSWRHIFVKHCKNTIFCHVKSGTTVLTDYC